MVRCNFSFNAPLMLAKYQNILLERTQAYIQCHPLRRVNNSFTFIPNAVLSSFCNRACRDAKTKSNSLWVRPQHQFSIIVNTLLLWFLLVANAFKSSTYAIILRPFEYYLRYFSFDLDVLQNFIQPIYMECYTI